MNRNCLFSKALALLLCAVLLIGYLPSIALPAAAEDWESDIDVVETTEEPTEEPTEAPGAESNPIMLLNQENVVNNAGTVYYQGYFSGMIMTVSGDGDFSVIYNGETIEAVDGVVSTSVASANPRMPVVFAVVGDGEFNINFAYPEGSMSNPTVAALGDNAASIEAGSQGYYFVYTADYTGDLVVTISGADNWTYVVNNLTTGSYGDSQWSDSDPVVNPTTIAVTANDEIQIIVNGYDPDDMWNTPAAELNVNLAYEPGSCPEAAIFLSEMENSVTNSGTVYYMGYFSGTTMTITGEGDFTVNYNGENISAVDGVVSTAVSSPNPRMPVEFSVTGEGAMTINFAFPAGSQSNPAVAVLGDNAASIEAGSQGYYFTYTAEKDGDLIVTISGADNWTYAINNLTAGSYGDTQWSDSDPVVNPATITVAQGNEIQIIVNGYDPDDMWNTPAADLNVNLAYAEDEPKEPVAKIGDETYTSVADALAAATAGQTVELIANAENEEIIIIQPGVTLDVKGFALTADVIIGLKGSFLNGTAMSSAGVTAGRLNVAEDNISLSAVGFYNASNQTYSIPVWINDHFAFAVSKIAVNSKNTADGVAAVNFTVSWSGGLRNYYLKTDGASDNALSVIASASWSGDSGTYTQDLVYKDEFIMTASTSSTGSYSVSIAGVDNMQGLALVPKVVTDSGIVIYGENYQVTSAVKASVKKGATRSESSEPVAQIVDGDTYTSVADALAAATSGQTVKLIANAPNEDIIIIQPGVTLNVGSYALTADVIIGLNGSFLTGDAMSSTGVTAGRLNVAEDNISLSAVGFYNASNQTYSIPVWINDHFAFAVSKIAVNSKNTADGVAAVNFTVSWSGGLRNYYLKTDGASDNALSVIASASWSGDSGTYTQDLVYKDEFIMTASTSSTGSYSVSIAGVDNMQGLKLTPKVVTDSGIIIYGEDYSVN